MSQIILRPSITNVWYIVATYDRQTRAICEGTICDAIRFVGTEQCRIWHAVWINGMWKRGDLIKQ